MTDPLMYRLRFHELAWQEWQRLDGSVKVPLRKKLLERLQAPHNPACALAGIPGCCKIKLRQAGYRLVYRVEDGVLTFTVIAVGRRDKSAVYATAEQRRG